MHSEDRRAIGVCIKLFGLAWFIHIFSHSPNEMYETAERPITEIPNKLQIQRELRRVTLRQNIVKSRCQL